MIGLNDYCTHTHTLALLLALQTIFTAALCLAEMSKETLIKDLLYIKEFSLRQK